MLTNCKKVFLQNIAKDKMTHFSISLSVKRCRDNNATHGSDLKNELNKIST